MKPFGSVLSKLDEISLETADGVEFKMKNSPLLKLAFNVIGVPHIEMRVRARLIFSYLPKKGNNKKILDAGCGPGIYSLTFKKKGFDVYAVDLDENKIDFLKKNTDINVLKADVTNLPFKDNFFDYIVASEVIEHVKDDPKAITEFTRVLKKDGVLIITVPKVSTKNILSYKKWGHYRPGYTETEFYSLKDFKVEKIKSYSSKVMAKMFDINERLYKSRLLLGALFYPLYLISLTERIISFGEFNGITAKLIKK